MLEDRPYRFPQRRGCQAPPQVQQYGLVPVMRVREALLEEPPLARKERGGAGDRPLLRTPTGGLRERRCLLGDGLVLKHHSWRERQAFLVGARDDLDAADGVAAEFEEVVVDTDGGVVEGGGPDGGELTLDRSGRWCMRVVDGGLRGGKVGAVKFAVGGVRDFGEDVVEAWVHVRRQLMAQVLTEAAGGRGVVGVFGLEVGGELALVGTDEGVEDVRVLAEDGFDLAGFDAVAADLELVVGAAEEFQAAVGAVAGAVAGAVEAGAGVRAVGMWQELPGG